MELISDCNSDKIVDDLFEDLLDSDGEIPYESLDEQSDSLEVYEEPDSPKDESLMLEVAQERLLEQTSGWSSSDDEEDDFIFDEFFQSPSFKPISGSFPKPKVVTPPSLYSPPSMFEAPAQISDPIDFVLEVDNNFSSQPIDKIKQSLDNIINTHNKAEVAKKSKEPAALNQTSKRQLPEQAGSEEKDVSKNSKKRKLNSSAPSKQIAAKNKNTRPNHTPSTSSSLTPSSSNQWLALAALNMQNLQAKTGAASTSKNSTAATFKSNLNLNSVASAAAALVKTIFVTFRWLTLLPC